MIPFFIWFEVFWGLNDELPRTCSSALSHSIDAGTGVEPVCSCGNDVGCVEPDELDEEEIADKPGTTIGTQFSVLHCFSNTIFNETWFLTVGPLI